MRLDCGGGVNFIGEKGILLPKFKPLVAATAGDFKINEVSADAG